jgi:membrane protein involved in colicin uptake
MTGRVRRKREGEKGGGNEEGLQEEDAHVSERRERAERRGRTIESVKDAHLDDQERNRESKEERSKEAKKQQSEQVGFSSLPLERQANGSIAKINTETRSDDRGGKNFAKPSSPSPP